MLTRRSFFAAALAGLATAQLRLRGQSNVVRYVRYEVGGKTSFGILEGETIREIAGDLFGARTPTGKSVKLSNVKLRYPIEPPKVLAVGLNYRSHIGDRPAPTRPEIFYKPITSLQDPGGPIIIPPGSKDLHYEAEFVIVMGKRAKNVSEAEAEDYILGYTCGNDVSERNWQNGSIDKDADLQWWRGKGADTFGPLGPAIAVGLDYQKSRIELRLNGEVKQTQVISDLVFGPPQIVSFISKYVTLTPGDVIYTGTPGRTSAMKAGDKVEVEISGIGVLANYVAKP
jgi:2-keto-4-pentenoate hydratase/2-oxohepta-3-ene-1,7-dioic acid hydratase in catechol pathway